MTGDPGVSKGQDLSEGALCVAGWDGKGHCWVVDFEAGHWNAKEFVEHAATMYQRWRGKIDAFGMEKVSFQAYAHAFIEHLANTAGMDLEIDELHGAHLGIGGRIMRMEPAAAQLQVHCATHLIAMLMPQWRKYPDPSGKKMDRLDALSYQYALDKQKKTWVQLPVTVSEKTEGPCVRPFDPNDPTTWSASQRPSSVQGNTTWDYRRR